MDSDIVRQILILVVLLLLSGFFSSSETSLVSVSKIRMRSLAEEGNTRAQKVLDVNNQQAKMLSAILIGNNLVNTFAASIATQIAYNFGGVWISVATFIITFLILLFGEITPKTWAAENSEKLALFYAGPIKTIMTILTPVIFVVNLFSGALLKLLGSGKDGNNPSMTESEIRTIVDMSHEEGVIEEDEKDMINNVFDLGDAVAKDVMVPRVRVIMADIESTYEDLLDLFKEEQFTRIPIYKDSIDNIVGLVNMKDLLLYRDFDHFKIEDILRKPYFTYENKPVSDLLLDMKHSTFNLAIVMDEYGELAGIITLEDIIEEIVGEVHDEYDSHEDDNIRETAPREYDIKGYMLLHDINDALDLNLDSEDFDSVGGLVIDHLGRLPEVGDEIVLEDGTKLQVKAIEKNHIEEIHMILPEPNKEKEEDE